MTWLSGEAKQVISEVRRFLAGLEKAPEQSTSEDSLAEPAWTLPEIERRRHEVMPEQAPVKPGIDEVSQDPNLFPLDDGD